MDTEKQEQLEAGLRELRSRIKTDSDKLRELVKIDVHLLLSGQEAVNYKVAKLFADDSRQEILIQTIFRIGLRNVTELLKVLAQENGIRL